MVKLNKIYTRTGDDGTTGLVDGSRLPKSSRRVAAYGTVDEANAAIGLCRLYSAGGSGGVASDNAAKDEAAKHDDERLARIQNDLFDLGADLATPAGIDGALRIEPAQITRLEREIDEMNADLAPLQSFVLPAGTALAAHLHAARTTVRRAERDAVHAAAEEEIGAAAIKYLNRLSDHLFVMARHANARGPGDVLWVPGANR